MQVPQTTGAHFRSFWPLLYGCKEARNNEYLHHVLLQNHRQQWQGVNFFDQAVEFFLRIWPTLKNR